MYKINSLAGLIILCLIIINASVELSSLVSLDVEGKNQDDLGLDLLTESKKISDEFTIKTNKFADKQLSNSKKDLNIDLESKFDQLDQEDDLRTNFFNPRPPNQYIQVKNENPYWYNVQWRYKKNITISSSNVEGDLTDFPLLVDIYDIDLKHALNNGFDILFTDETNNKLSHEIEFFDKYYNSTHSHLVAWVKTNLSSSFDTTLNMYFGYPFSENQQNPSDVWSNGYEAVWHMNEKPSDMIIDSIGNFNGTALGSMTSNNLQQGKISNSIDFDGTDDRIVTENINSDDWTQITLEAWIKHDSLLDQGSIITKELPGGGTTIWALRVENQRLQSRLRTNTNYYWVQTSSDVITNINTWYQVVFTWDGTTEYYYVDDTFQGTYSTLGSNIRNADNQVSIGCTYNCPTGDLETFNGLIDELRVSSVTRSGEWVYTQNHNQKDPDSFYSIGEIQKYELEQNWPFYSLDYRKNITILSDKINQSVTDFPYLLDLIDEDLHDKAQQDGEDILFTDALGNRLEFEIEEYDNAYSATQARLIAWINIPELKSDSNSTISMYYGNSTVIKYDQTNGVWFDYLGVWHLSETVADGAISLEKHKDSTGNGYNGDQRRNDDIEGVISNGQNFDGSFDRIQVTSSRELSSSSAVVISGWFRLNNDFNSSTYESQVLLVNYLDNSNNLHLGLAGQSYSRTDVPNGSLVFKVEKGGSFTYKWTNTTSWQANTWYYFSLFHSPTNPSSNKIYINGIDDTNINDDSCIICILPLDYSGEWSFGGGETDVQFPNGLGWFNGSLDEIRIRDGIYNNSRLPLEMDNQLNPQEYYEVNEEFIADFRAPIINDFGVDELGTGQVVFWANVTDFKSTVTSVTMEINSSSFNMTFDGFLWTLQQSVIFQNIYYYKIVNTTDSIGNFLTEESIEKNSTFLLDITTPNIIDILFDPGLGYYGTFRVNVSDNWGIISNVTIEILSCQGTCPTGPIELKWTNGNEYINNDTLLQRGQITFTVSAIDLNLNEVNSPEQQATVTNKAPKVNNISFSSIMAPSNSTLGITYDYYDPDGDQESGSEIRWYKNNILQNHLNNKKTIDSSELSRNDSWYVIYNPKDGIEFGSVNHTFINATIINSAPIATNLQITPNPTTTVDLIANWDYSDVDNDAQNSSWIIKWYLFGNPQGFFNNQTTVTNSATHRGEIWYYTLQVYDGREYSIVFTSNSTTIINSAPKALNPKINDGNPVVQDNDDLNVNFDFYDADTGDLLDTFIIFWFINNTYNGTFYNLTTISFSNTTVNSTWYFKIQVSDGISSANYTSQAVSIGSASQNTPPTASNLQILGEIYDCSILECFTNYNLNAVYTYNDGDNNEELNSEIRWYKNGVLQTSYNNTKYIPYYETTRNDIWYFTITPYDVLGLNGLTYTSASIEIRNSLPTVTNVQLGPTTAFTSSTLTISYIYNDIDNDFFSNYTIKWYINSSEQTILENQTEINSYYLFKADIWYFTISVSDGTDWSNPESSNIIIIQNSLPTIANISLLGGLNTNENITLAYDFNDLDGDLDYSTFIWLIDGDPDSTTSKTLSSQKTKAGSRISVIITLKDYPSSPGVLIFSFNYPEGSVVVRNSQPIIDGFPQIVGESGNASYPISSDLRVIYNASDIDGIDDNTQYDIDYDDINNIVQNAEYRWFKLIGGTWVEQLGLNDYIIPKNNLIKGNSWKISVRIVDNNGMYSLWYNSSVITIENSAPSIDMITFSNIQPTSQDNIHLMYHYVDINNDLESQSWIRWYKNGIEIIANENRTTLNQAYFVKGDRIQALIQPFDGDLYGSIYNSSIMSGLLIVKNSLPVINSISINNYQSSFTNNNLSLLWEYYDFDDDPENTDELIVYWYKNGFIIPELTNQTTVNYSLTYKNERWQVFIKVFDGENYSNLVSSNSLYIQNSIPSLSNVQINSNESLIFANESLIANYNVFDLDQDLVRDYQIYWYRNGLLVPLSNKTNTITAFYLIKGDFWYFTISVTDNEQNWSGNYTSQIIYVVNSEPGLSDFSFIFPAENIDPIVSSRSFYLSNENIIIEYKFIDNDNDTNNSIIYWFKNGQLQSDLTNFIAIESSYTTEGEKWYVLIIPNDGVTNGSTFQSQEITIVSVPIIHDVWSNPADLEEFNEEGYFKVEILTNDSNREIKRVQVNLNPNIQNDSDIADLFNKLSSTTYFAKLRSSNVWYVSNLDILQTIDHSEFASYIGKEVIFEIIVFTEFNDFTISSIKYISYIIQDTIPPRVVSVSVSSDNANNPSVITFLAEIEEYGLGIQNVTLFYDFKLSEEKEENDTNSLSQLKIIQSILSTDNFTAISLNAINSTHYTATINVKINSSVLLLYYLQVSDKSGNTDPHAWSQGLDEAQAVRFSIPNSGLSIELVLIVVLIIMVIATAFSFIVIKKFRKTDIVGLDIDEILKEVEKITQKEIDDNLDDHTLGIIISTFDQSHGPIPIFVHPELLKDNIDKLIDLSDRSFSSTRFIENFEKEIQIMFEYVMTPMLEIMSISYGFSLNRPNLRGGMENITLNILMHKPYEEIIAKVIQLLNPLVHEIHIMMDQTPEEKNEIQEKNWLLRRNISSIILAYEKLYKDLPSEDNE